MVFLNKALLVLLSAANILYAQHERFSAWTVIGAGPGGISAVGALLDYGVDGKTIFWIDPAFSGGGLSNYPCVSSNTKSQLFRTFFTSCHAFGMKALLPHFQLYRYDDEQPCPLSVVVDPLIATTQNLLRKVKHVKGSVDYVAKVDGGYRINVGSQIINTKNLVLAQGALPKTLNYQAHVISLSDALNKEKLQSLVSQDDTVVVCGTSHSGVLILKNLCELNVKKIISIAKRPLLFAQERDGLYLYDNTGLKGVAADWGRDVFQNNPPDNLIKVMNPTDEECKKLIESSAHVIYAIGFQAQQIDGLDSDVLNSYDSSTGIIDQGLFGIGFAFPELVDDDSGQKEHAVGVLDFGDYAQTVVPLWLSKTRKICATA